MAQRRAERALAQPALASREAALHAAQLKSQLLTLDLAHHKRLRFGPPSAALSHRQGDLFAETALIDQAAIEAEIARLANQMQPTRPTRPRWTAALTRASPPYRTPARTGVLPVRAVR